ncbi:4-(cytidine 5'-diphospho)-2-C-methyl-D-erythritol kinase [Alicyclobacillus mengziensis]|uniref:4-diphosphocytidyl-2-C-methyl-D-erythritol kinase n=1 Tax=Alicyclobacillus mengziensis TaxID=2931921 RepID=A0A9X7Z713_9BACL|nr:4-(cytidine 5'-diphospho)-2-C-methyl-D-erythritol kinase [Alicyclobacillus mengziensis]QSO47927.1 4-(cytidine 5'-diphospho)-2-C-methyl-D-erythritol kinase [Alicyclobacillus mengziensis]
MLVERAYAKINLTLDVLGRRPDGYHEVDMVMQSVDLSDLLWIDKSDAGIRIESGASNIPLDERNLAYVAAEAFLRKANISSGISIGLEKNIPVAAGLAGGSSDAAAVLRGLNRLFATGYSLDELAELGASIGSDVPFCVYGGCAVARGRGERLQRVHHQMRAWVIIIRPPVFVSTADIYGALTPKQMTQVVRSKSMIESLMDGDFERMVGLVDNRLRPATQRLYPEVAEYAERLSSTLGQPVHMSGSGPTLFLLAPNERRAQRSYNAIRGFMKEVYLCRFI